MLKLMTINLNYRQDTFGTWAQRKRSLLNLILEMHPNIVALQAVDGSGDNHSQAQELAEGAGYLTAVFAADRATCQGSAFLLDRPAFQVETQPMARQTDDEDQTARILLAARVAWNREGATAWIVNGHFSAIPTQNERPVAETQEFMRRLGTTAALMGNFNITPGHGGPTELARQGLIDCWSSERPNEPGYTFGDDKLAARIDYTWVHPNSARVREIYTAPSAGPMLSDHRTLIATLET